MEAVTHALRWISSRGDSQTTHAIILTDSMSLLRKVKSRMGSPDWNVPMVDIHRRKLVWRYCPGHAGVKGNDRADSLPGKAAITSKLTSNVEHQLQTKMSQDVTLQQPTGES